MDIAFIIHILFVVLAFGCILAILLWMFNLVEGKVPEPMKQMVGWLKVFVLLVCGVIAICFIAQLAGLDTSGRIGRL